MPVDIFIIRLLRVINVIKYPKFFEMIYKMETLSISRASLYTHSIGALYNSGLLFIRNNNHSPKGDSTSLAYNQRRGHLAMHPSEASS
jgi:hypothetical protein